MSNFLKKFFGSITEKSWEAERAAIDTAHTGRTFEISTQKSAVIIIFGIATVLFSLIFTGYIYSLPPGQITNDLEKKETSKVKKNLIIVGGLSYMFLFGQVIFWVQLMKNGNYISTNSYFSSFYVFTALHGLHLLGGLFFWGKVSSRVLKLDSKKILDESKNISALSMYWTFLLIVWFMFFLMIYIFNDAVLEFCRNLIS